MCWVGKEQLKGVCQLSVSTMHPTEEYGRNPNQDKQKFLQNSLIITQCCLRFDRVSLLSMGSPQTLRLELSTLPKNINAKISVGP